MPASPCPTQISENRYIDGQAGLAAPFLLATPDTRIREIGPWQERGETWQRLTALFPAGAGTMAREQTFYFDREGLQPHRLRGTR